jgi:hypothetical protein
MDREHDPRGNRGSGHWLCAAGGRLRARVPRSTGLRRPAALSPAGRLPGPAGSPSTFTHCRVGCPARSTNDRLAGSGSSPGSRARAGTAAATRRRPSADSRCGSGRATTASGRGHPGRSRPRLCLDLGLLGLERPLGMGRRPLGGPPQAHCHLGGGPLVATRQWLRVDRRRLAVVPKRLIRLPQTGSSHRGMRACRSPGMGRQNQSPKYSGT